MKSKEILFFLVSAFFLFSFDCFSLPSFKPSKTTNIPTVLKADQVDGDSVNKTIRARGNVEVRKDTSVIYADEVIYHKNDKIIKAIGQVKVKNIEIGDMLSSDVSVKEDFSSGEFLDAKLFLHDGSYFLSKKVTKKNEDITILKKALYSFCPNPSIKPEKYPEINGGDDFAYIKTEETMIDNKNRVVKGKGGVFYLYNVPVFYLPYVKMPIPAKKRESGFLTPSYTKTTNFGVGVRVPYYFNIDENIDLTTTPQISFNGEQIIVQNKLRHNLKYGDYETNFEIANNEITSNDDRTITNRTNKELRWNLKTFGDFDFTTDYALDFNINAVSDKDYLRDYHFNYLPFSQSEIEFNHRKKRDYYAVKTVRLQELENASVKDGEVVALPIVDHHIESDPFFFKERLSLTSNLTTISREDGLQYRRLSSIPKVEVPFNLNGNLFKLAARVQGDFYWLEDNYKALAKDNDYKSTQNNFKPEASLKWSLPLIRKKKESTFLLEPMASIVSSSTRKNFRKVPNEDSNNAELTVNNLFINDRISGFDRNENGERFNYGVKTSLFNNYGEFGFTVGQAYRNNAGSQDVTIRGFADNDKSNIVGQFLYRNLHHFSLLYLFQLDQSDYQNDVNQVTASLNYDSFSVSSDYLLIRETIQNEQEREQLNLSTDFKFNNRWSGKVSFARDMVLGRTISRTFAISREGCCSNFTFSVVENNQSNLIEAQRSFNLSISFKNL